jgi:hypothetical protein
MSRFVVVLILLFSFHGFVFSNPVESDPYTMVAITEVYIPQPEDWYIELDGERCLFDFGNADFPLTTDLYLRIVGPISRIDETYHARVEFKENYYGVISRASLVDLDQGERVSITSTDTIMVARDTVGDSLWATPEKEVRYWKFPLRRMSNENVLVALYMNQDTLPELFETSRKSIGYEGSYTSICNLTIQSNHDVPLHDIYGSCSALDRKITDRSGSCRIETSLLRPEGTYKFSDPYSVDAYAYSSEPLSSYSVSYNDKDSVVYDTLRLDVTEYIVTVNDDFGNPVDDCSFFYKRPPPPEGTIAMPYCKFEPLRNVTPEKWLFRIYKSLPVETLLVAWDVPTLCTDSINYFTTWSGVYNESADSITTSVIVDHAIIPTSADRRKALETPSSTTMSVKVQDNRSVLIIVMSSHTFHGAFATLYTLAGRKITSVPIDIYPGTNTVQLRLTKGEVLSRGTYLSRLSIRGCAPLSSLITIP